jgi:hypothetical protein
MITFTLPKELRSLAWQHQKVMYQLLFQCAWDTLSVKDGKVTYRYLESKTKRYKTITLSGSQFLWRVLQHVLPKGFRRARHYGFLHPNSKQLIRLIQLILKVSPIKWLLKKKVRASIKCRCCGGLMHIVQTRIKRSSINLVPT